MSVSLFLFQTVKPAWLMRPLLCITLDCTALNHHVSTAWAIYHSTCDHGRAQSSIVFRNLIKLTLVYSGPTVCIDFSHPNPGVDLCTTGQKFWRARLFMAR